MKSHLQFTFPTSFPSALQRLELDLGILWTEFLTTLWIYIFFFPDEKQFNVLLSLSYNLFPKGADLNPYFLFFLPRAVD